jgi:hypothetical protein
MSAPNGVPRNTRNQELRLFGAKHREIAAATPGSIRDHIDWTKYFDPQVGRFMPKKAHFTDADGKRHNRYQTLIKQGAIEPPTAHFYDTTTERFVHQSSVLKEGAVLSKYAGRHMKGKVIFGVDHDVTVRTILFSAMEDADGNQMKALKAAHRADKTLAHAVDPDGYYHQEIKEFVFTTKQSSLKPYSLNKVFWVKGAHFPDYINYEKEHSAGNPLFVGVFYETLEVFSSGLTGIKFVSAVEHDPAAAFKRLTVPNRADNECEHIYSPYTTARAKEGATSLDDWLLPAYKSEWDKGGAAPAIDELDVIGGCGYNVVLQTFTDSFKKLRNFDKGVDKRTGERRIGKYLEVKMTKRWLYENIFHVGEVYDKSKLALSALELRRFYEHYRVNLFVFDITGRIDTEASYTLPIGTENKHLRPATTYVLQHNKHLFLLTEGVKSLTQMKLNTNSVLYQPLKPFERIEVDDEDAAKPPSQSYFIGDDTVPVLFCETIADLPTLKIHIPKRNKDGEVMRNKKGEVIEHEKVRVACPCSLWLVLSELLIKCKYEPKVSMAGGAIVALTLKIDDVLVSISPPDAPPDDKVPYIPTENIFRLYSKHDLVLKQALRNKETISTYSGSLLKALILGKTPTLFRSPLVFGSECDDDNLLAHDLNKAYTSFVKEIKVVPVFNEFDEFERFIYEKEHKLVVLDEVNNPDVDDALSHCSDPSSPQVLVAPFASGGMVQTSIEPFLYDKPVFSLHDTAAEIKLMKKAKMDNSSILKALSAKYPSEHVAPLLYSERDKHAFYLVQRVGEPAKNNLQKLLLDQEYNLLTFDTWLIVRDWDCCTTLGVIKPSKIVPVAVGKAIDDLWADKLLPVPLKKFLANKHVGLCGKRFNKKHDTLIFTDNDEAMHYYEQLGGKEHAEHFVDVVGGRKLYFVTRNRQTLLKDGFFPIQHIVYDKQRMALYHRALAVGKPVIAAKVDCLWFEGFDEKALVPKNNSAKGIGTWSVLKSDGHPVKELLDKSWLKWDEHLPVLDNAAQVTNIPIKNEWRFDEFKEIFDNGNHVLILANIPGAGKTHSLIEYCKPLGDKALFVCPYNALADDLNGKGVKAITLHNLLGLMGGSDSDDKKKPYVVSGVTHIIYDEIFCHSTYMLANIRRYNALHLSMEDGTERKFFAAGDNNQNSPIETLSLERLERKAYYFDCVSTIFDTHITLEVCKRVSTDKQRADLVVIKDLVLNSATPLIDIARRFFKPITTLEEVKGMSVCYLNETARIVNNFCNAEEVPLIDPSLVIANAGRNYWAGQTLRCRKLLEVNGERMHINYVYSVSGRTEHGLRLTSSLGTAYDVSFAQLAECFAYNYAHTCHSLQGMSVSTGITLHDLCFFYVTREWFYTALTRSRDLDEIYFWDPSVVLHDLQVVKEGELQLKIERKIAGYKVQDAKAGRLYDDAAYINHNDVIALLDEQERRCCVCAEVVSLVWKDAKDDSQFTVDRLDNDIAHVKGNCAISCLGCNRAKH